MKIAESRARDRRDTERVPIPPSNRPFPAQHITPRNKSILFFPRRQPRGAKGRLLSLSPFESIIYPHSL